jgi:hypothetical protein
LSGRTARISTPCLHARRIDLRIQAAADRDDRDEQPAKDGANPDHATS